MIINPYPYMILGLKCNIYSNQIETLYNSENISIQLNDKKTQNYERKCEIKESFNNTITSFRNFISFPKLENRLCKIK